MDFSIYKNARVLITGHTGFKGSWLLGLLDYLGADVIGYALEPDTTPSLFNLMEGIRSVNPLLQIFVMLIDYNRL